MVIIPKQTMEVLNTFKSLGVKFNIITKIEHRFELHYAYRRMDGIERVHFVAELDGFGNVQEFGQFFEDLLIGDKVINADGEEV